MAGQTFLAVSVAGILAGGSLLSPTLAQQPPTGVPSCGPFTTTCPLTSEQAQQARQAQDKANAADRSEPKTSNPLPDESVQVSEEDKIKMVEAVRPHLRQGLQSSNPESRERALEMLHLLPEAEVIAAFDENVRSNNPRIKIAAACALKQAEVPFEAVSATLLRLFKDADWMVRVCALQSLAWLGGSAATEVLLEGLNDPNSVLRSQTAQALGKLDALATGPVDALITALSDDNPFVRQAAAEALGNQKVTRAVPDLEAMKARSQKINGRLWVDGEAAERALRQIKP